MSRHVASGQVASWCPSGASLSGRVMSCHVRSSQVTVPPVGLEASDGENVFHPVPRFQLEFSMKPDLSKIVPPLSKGDTIDVETVVLLMGLSPDECLDQDRLRLAALGLASAVERALHRIGRPWTVRAVNGTVRVLTDVEAISFRARQNRSGVRKIRRSVVGLQGVDTSALGAFDRCNHGNILGRASAQVAALNALGRRRDPSLMSQPVPVADPSRPRPAVIAEITIDAVKA